jgi:glycosyltransferase involved in cell wall biosynthesis
MKISIITVCYNAQSFIESAITSVLSQTYSNIEYIIVDGNSTDATMSIVNRYADKIATIISEPDKGIYDAMNKGIACATGDVVGILNADDFYIDSNVIELIVEQAQNNPDVDVFFGGVDFVHPQQLDKVIRRYQFNAFKSWYLRIALMPPHPATFVRRSVYEKYGFYKIDYKIAADFDMFIRMIYIAKVNYMSLSATMVRMREGGVSTSGFSAYLLSTREMLRALKDNKVYSNLFLVLLRLPIKLMQRIFS